jgi:endonuclease III
MERRRSGGPEDAGNHLKHRRRGILVAIALTREYGRPDLGNKPDPLDELVYISLTRQTHEQNALRTWVALTTAYPTWEMLLESPEQEIAGVIADGGYARQTRIGWA